MFPTYVTDIYFMTTITILYYQLSHFQLKDYKVIEGTDLTLICRNMLNYISTHISVIYRDFLANMSAITLIILLFSVMCVI